MLSHHKTQHQTLYFYLKLSSLISAQLDGATTTSHAIYLNDNETLIACDFDSPSPSMSELMI